MIESPSASGRYQRPGWVARRVVNPMLSYATQHFGLSIDGACVLAVRGRHTGVEREVVVYVLRMDDDGGRFLVAPRGETDWVRNLRRAGVGVLRLGRREEIVHAFEVRENARPPILRAYLRRWGRIVGRYFDVTGPDADATEFRRIAHAHPVFRLSHR
jgi:hypothetical protein